MVDAVAAILAVTPAIEAALVLLDRVREKLDGKGQDLAAASQEVDEAREKIEAAARQLLSFTGCTVKLRAWKHVHHTTTVFKTNLAGIWTDIGQGQSQFIKNANHDPTRYLTQLNELTSNAPGALILMRDIDAACRISPDEMPEFIGMGAEYWDDWFDRECKELLGCLDSNDYGALFRKARDLLRTINAINAKANQEIKERSDEMAQHLEKFRIELEGVLT